MSCNDCPHLGTCLGCVVHGCTFISTASVVASLLQLATVRFVELLVMSTNVVLSFTSFDALPILE